MGNIKFMLYKLRFNSKSVLNRQRDEEGSRIKIKGCGEGQKKNWTSNELFAFKAKTNHRVQDQTGSTNHGVNKIRLWARSAPSRNTYLLCLYSCLYSCIHVCIHVYIKRPALPQDKEGFWC